MSTLSLREVIAVDIVEVLGNITDPQSVLVTREPFEVDKLAITQFPAILVQLSNEQRETVSMGVPGVGRRMGTIEYTIRGFVRGTELDSRRNELITAIETALETDRYRTFRSQGVIDSQVIGIEVVPRQQPLAEFIITFQVRYNYLRGSL
jgi:hypothetical protein